jgi:hypothetical protein
MSLYESYKNYPTVDLLIMARMPSEYTPEAMEAVAQLLTERTVTDADLEEVARHFQHIADKSQRVSTYKQQVGSLFQQGGEWTPQRWLPLLLILVAVHFVWTVVRRGLTTRYYLTHITNIAVAAEYFNLVYIAITWYLLYRKRRWGWILLCAFNLFSLLGNLSMAYYFFKYQDIHHGSTSAFLWDIFVESGFLFFLLRNQITEYFQVTKTVRQRTLFVTGGIFLLLFVASRLF